MSGIGRISRIQTIQLGLVSVNALLQTFYRSLLQSCSGLFLGCVQRSNNFFSFAEICCFFFRCLGCLCVADQSTNGTARRIGWAVWIGQGRHIACLDGFLDCFRQSGCSLFSISTGSLGQLTTGISSSPNKARPTGHDATRQTTNHSTFIDFLSSSGLQTCFAFTISLETFSTCLCSRGFSGTQQGAFKRCSGSLCSVLSTLEYRHITDLFCSSQACCPQSHFVSCLLVWVSSVVFLLVLLNTFLKSIGCIAYVASNHGRFASVTKSTYSQLRNVLDDVLRHCAWVIYSSSTGFRQQTSNTAGQLASIFVFPTFCDIAPVGIKVLSQVFGKCLATGLINPVTNIKSVVDRSCSLALSTPLFNALQYSGITKLTFKSTVYITKREVGSRYPRKTSHRGFASITFLIQLICSKVFIIQRSCFCLGSQRARQSQGITSQA